MIPVPAQIGKLIPRLASEHEGEVVATARAIERVLKTAGLDWHSLAERIGQPDYSSAFRYPYSANRPSPSPAASQPSPRPPEKPRKPRKRAWDTFRRSEQQRIVEVMLALSDLTDCDRNLLGTLAQDLHDGRMSSFTPSETRTLSRLRSRVGI